MRMTRIVSVSGGKDSTALYLLALERGKPFSAVFADTGHEAAQTYEYIRTLPERTGGPAIRTVKADYTERLRKRREKLPELWRKKGVPQEYIDRAIPLLQPTGIPFVDASLWNGIFPAPKQRYCTRELKQEPIEEQVYRPILERGEHLVSWQGIRAEESIVRADMKARQHLSGKYGNYHVLRPLLHWKLDDVLAMHGKHGIKANPLYAEGFSRVGCFPCIYAQKSEIALLARKYPEVIDRMERWEQLLNDTGRVSRSASFFWAGQGSNVAEGPAVWYPQDRRLGTNQARRQAVRACAVDQRRPKSIWPKPATRLESASDRSSDSRVQRFDRPELAKSDEFREKSWIFCGFPPISPYPACISS